MNKGVSNLLIYILIVLTLLELLTIYKSFENIYIQERNYSGSKQINQNVAKQINARKRLTLSDLLNNLYDNEGKIMVNSMALGNNEVKLELEIKNEEAISVLKAISENVKISRISKKADSDMNVLCVYRLEK